MRKNVKSVKNVDAEEKRAKVVVEAEVQAVAAAEVIPVPIDIKVMQKVRKIVINWNKRLRSTRKSMNIIWIRKTMDHRLILKLNK